MALSHTESTLVAVGGTLLVLSVVVTAMVAIWQVESRKQRHREMLVQAPPPRPVQYGLNLPPIQSEYTRLGVESEGDDIENGFALQGYRGVGSRTNLIRKDADQAKLDSIRRSLIVQRPPNLAESNETVDSLSTKLGKQFSERTYSLQSDRSIP